MLKFKLWKFVACVAVLVAGAGRGEAASYKLSDLLAGGSFQSGDKLFSNFHNASETGNAGSLGYENITLTTISQPNRNLNGVPFPSGWTLPPGCTELCATEFGFRVSGAFDVTQNQDYNLAFDFKVAALDPNCACIYAIETELTGNATNGEVDSSTGVTVGLTSLAATGVFVHDPGTIKLVDRHYFTDSDTGLPAAPNVIDVSFGLQLQAHNVFGAQASADHVDVMFAQSGVPEPSTYALLLLGSAGVGLMVRRKRS